MKKEVLIFIIVLFMCIGAVAGIYCYNILYGTKYYLKLPIVEDLSNIKIEQNDNSVVINEFEKMKDIIYVLGGVVRETREKSVQDYPNAIDEIQVDFQLKNNKIATIWGYEEDNKYYIEQAYNGIYRISADEYNSIENYLRK